MPKGDLSFLSYMQVWKRRSGGTFMGQLADPDNPTPDTVSHAYLIEDPIDLTLPEISREVANFKGGGNYFGRKVGMIQNIPDITFTLAHVDAVLRALGNRSKIDTTSVSGWEISGENENEFELEQLGLSIHVMYQDRDAGTDGDNKWWNLIIPQGELLVRRPAQVGIRGGDNTSPARGVFTPSLGGKFPTGVAFGANQGFKGNRAMGVEIVTDYPLALSTFFRDGTETTYTLAYLPVYDDVSGGNTNNWFTLQGTPTAPTSVAPTTGLVTNAAAGTSGHQDIAWYQTRFVPAA